MRPSLFCRLSIRCLSICCLSIAAAVSLAAEPERAVSLFDGKSFKGWEGDQKVFRIEDGAIVGGSLERINPRNEFLCTEREYGDFELALKFKVLGKGANA